ncbi:MAG: molybdenum cofactor guanylyltransferase [Proteobacteria bacterium]|uniref:molybdenum cofactor guanylyltransferase MobA n=1 Tax=Rudaea sp. TaxID=2136325 RepID=UPI00322006AF|nr:molybdenum cofactor guanylyltransferase [Pseudomonadota bacterium]
MTDAANAICAAILAGGEGRRVGGDDKGLLMLCGKPMVEHVAAALRGQVDAVLVCANRNAGEYAKFGEVIADTASGFHGPLAGIATALAHFPGPWLLTVPVDAPAPPHDLAARLRAAATAAGADAAVAHDGMRRQPLFALYRGSLAQAAARALADDLPVWQWQDRIGAVEVDFCDQAQSFVNLNTLEEFREWERQHAG